MGYAEKRGQGANTYYLARFNDGNGKWPTVKTAAGGAIRYRKKIDAEKAADDEEAKVRAGRWHDPNAGNVAFGLWANKWYAVQDLAPSTLQNLKHHIEEHLLPEFENDPLNNIDAGRIDAWAKKEAAAGYKPSSIKTWRGTLHTILADAVDGREVSRVLGSAASTGGRGLLDFNPATKRRGRGKRAGRARHRGPEKAIVDDLGALLIAERASLLTGRDGEFVLVVTGHWTGLRWGELIGLETQYARLGSLRVESQLYELDSGELLECPPKDDSFRTVDVPVFLSKLISSHLARTQPKPCACHGKKYVFRGLDSSAGRGGAVTIADVAKRAGVSTGTVSTVLNHPGRVAEATRERVEGVMDGLGFTPSRSAPATAGGVAHWRRSGFATWVFAPAASGWYPRKAPQPARPVPLLADPWPGRPVRGRNSQGRAELAWLPIAQRLTPHGLRHSHRTVLEEDATPPVLTDERMGHEDGSVGRRYTHVTAAMRKALCDRLTERWEAALDARLALCPTSPVMVLDALLQARARQMEVGRSEDRPTEFPQEGVSVLRPRPRKRA